MPDFGIGEAAVAATVGGFEVTAPAAATTLGLTAPAWGAIGAGTSLAGVAGQTLAGVRAAGGAAQVAELEAASARAKAAFDAGQTDRAGKLMIARGVATAGAAGLDVSSGSPLLNELDNVKQNALQKQNILNTGQMQGNALDFQAKLARASIAGTETAGLANAGSVLSSWMGSRQYAMSRGY